LPVIEHGCTEIHLPHWEGIEQQHGFVHGGIVGTIADSAAGYAGMTVVPASASVLTVEYKLNLVAADGQRLIARGQVVRRGRRLIEPRHKSLPSTTTRKPFVRSCSKRSLSCTVSVIAVDLKVGAGAAPALIAEIDCPNGRVLLS
jgi:uncharacterized protein (TIGR00369 family)